jgi:tetratricopeptide (TPR) repeat protein
MNNCSRALEIIDAASLIDPENEKISYIITRKRQDYRIQLVAQMEQEIRENLSQKMSEIEALVDTNDFVKSDKLLDEIYDEKSSECVYLKGLTIYKRGGLRESQDIFREALNLDQHSNKAKELLQKAKSLEEKLEVATSALSNKDFSKVVSALTEALEIDESNQAVNQIIYFQRAIAYFNEGNQENSFKDYKLFEKLKSSLVRVLTPDDE